MDYELAKELRDAGFPQQIEGANGDGYFIRQRGCGECRVPTLSELIEACGAYISLQSPQYLGGEAEKDGYWRAIGRNGTRCTSFGKTAKEAVARLWLALNKEKV